MIFAFGKRWALMAVIFANGKLYLPDGKCYFAVAKCSFSLREKLWRLRRSLNARNSLTAVKYIALASNLIVDQIQL